MLRKSIRFEKATKDITDRFDIEPIVSYSGDVIYYGNEIAAIVGITLGTGLPYLFLHILSDNLPKYVIYKTAINYVKTLKKSVYCTCDENDNSANKFVQKLGFEYMLNEKGFNVYFRRAV